MVVLLGVDNLTDEGLWMSGELGGTGNNKNEWVAARGAVRRVSWSHPEFGQLLATAGAGEFAFTCTLDV